MVQKPEEPGRTDRGGLERPAELVSDQQDPELRAEAVDGAQGREDLARREQRLLVEREPAPAELVEGLREPGGDLIEVPDEELDVRVLPKEIGQADGVVRDN